LRNSLDDATPVKSGCFGISYVSDNASVTIQDISTEGFGGNSIHFQMAGAAVTLTRVLHNDLDVYTQFAVAPNGRPFQAGTGYGTRITMQASGYLGVIGVGGNDGVMYISRIQQISMSGCYFKGGDYGILLEALSSVMITYSVFDRVTGGSIPTLMVTNVANFYTYNFGGKLNEIRGATSVAGILLEGGSQMPVASTAGWNYYNAMMFSDCTVPCVILRSKSSINGQFSSVGNDLIDGGGNTSYGIVFEEEGCAARLSAASDVTGALGDVFIGGSVHTHTDIKNNGPFYDLAGNVVSHV
jgi:hypothetical protein